VGPCRWSHLLHAAASPAWSRADVFGRRSRAVAPALQRARRRRGAQRDHRALQHLHAPLPPAPRAARRGRVRTRLRRLLIEWLKRLLIEWLQRLVIEWLQRLVIEWLKRLVIEWLKRLVIEWLKRLVIEWLQRREHARRQGARDTHLPPRPRAPAPPRPQLVSGAVRRPPRGARVRLDAIGAVRVGGGVGGAIGAI
jgi:hypothetical protein